jgi:hypothetical protein
VSVRFCPVFQTFTQLAPLPLVTRLNYVLTLFFKLLRSRRNFRISGGFSPLQSSLNPFNVGFGWLSIAAKARRSILYAFTVATGFVVMRYLKRCLIPSIFGTRA